MQNKAETGNSSRHEILIDEKKNCEEFFDPRLVTLDPGPYTKKQTPVF